MKNICFSTLENYQHCKDTTGQIWREEKHRITTPLFTVTFPVGILLIHKQWLTCWEADREMVGVRNLAEIPAVLNGLEK